MTFPSESGGNRGGSGRCWGCFATPNLCALRRHGEVTRRFKPDTTVRGSACGHAPVCKSISGPITAISQSWHSTQCCVTSHTIKTGNRADLLRRKRKTKPPCLSLRVETISVKAGVTLQAHDAMWPACYCRR